MLSTSRIYPLYQSIASNVYPNLTPLLSPPFGTQKGIPNSNTQQGAAPNWVSNQVPLLSAGSEATNAVVNAFLPPGAAASTPPLITQTFTSPSGYPLTLFTLPNGHRLMVEQRPTDFIAVRTFVNAGSAMENAIVPSPLYTDSGLPSGIAHLDEHAHFLATQNFPQKNTWLGAASQLGLRWNASTSDEMIQHELFFNREDLPAALKMHVESVLRPYYNATDLQQEKNNVLNEFMHGMVKPSPKMVDQLHSIMFDRPDRQTLGSPVDILRTTPADMQRFHNTAYVPTNLVTIVTGNVNPQEILNQMTPDLLSNPAQLPVQAGLSPANTALRLALKPGEVKVSTVTDPQLNQEIVSMGFPAPLLGNTRERMAMEFLSRIFGNSAESVMKKTLVDQTGLATSASMAYEPLKQAGLVTLELETPLGKSQQAASALLNQVAAFPKQLVSDELLNQTRQILIQNFKEEMSHSEIASKVMGESAVTNTLPYVLHFEQLANQITVEDLRAVAQKYLTPNRYALVYGLPKAKEVLPVMSNAGAAVGNTALNLNPFSAVATVAPVGGAQ